jgi:hypothetical protein
MSKKASTNSGIRAAKNGTPKDIVVPDEALQIIGPYILERLDDSKDLEETIADLKADVELAALFLEELKDDVTFGELDLLSGGGWTAEPEKKLRRIYRAKPGMTRIDGEPRVIYC